MSIVTEWEIKTRAALPRSAELKKVDAAVNVWASKGQGIKDVNMQHVWNEFSAWKLAKSAEYGKIRLFADQLEIELANKWSAKPAQIGGVQSSNTKPVGWRLVNYDPLIHGGSMLPGGQHAPPLTPAQIQKVNEAMRRVQGAVESARDALIKIAGRKSFAVVPTPTEEKAYLDFFGAYDATRFARVLDNFKALMLAFNGTPNFIDVRNRTVWATTYGGCVRANLVVKATGQSLSLSGSVEMLMGRAFLGSGGYEKTTDDTIGTLVHEFSHGTVNAVDVPETDGVGAFQCTRTSDNPADAAFGNSTDPFGHQASTEALGLLLAQFKPEYAIVNADAYGQFTRRILTSKGG